MNDKRVAEVISAAVRKSSPRFDEQQAHDRVEQIFAQTALQNGAAMHNGFLFAAQDCRHEFAEGSADWPTHQCFEYLVQAWLLHPQCNVTEAHRLFLSLHHNSVGSGLNDWMMVETISAQKQIKKRIARLSAAEQQKFAGWLFDTCESDEYLIVTFMQAYAFTFWHEALKPMAEYYRQIEVPGDMEYGIVSGLWETLLDAQRTLNRQTAG